MAKATVIKEANLFGHGFFDGWFGFRSVRRFNYNWTPSYLMTSNMSNHPLGYKSSFSEDKRSRPLQALGDSQRGWRGRDTGSSHLLSQSGCRLFSAVMYSEGVKFKIVFWFSGFRGLYSTVAMLKAWRRLRQRMIRLWWRNCVSIKSSKAVQRSRRRSKKCLLGRRRSLVCIKFRVETWFWRELLSTLRLHCGLCWDLETMVLLSRYLCPSAI